MSKVFYLASCPHCGGDLYRLVADGQVESFQYWKDCLQCSYIIYTELFMRQLIRKKGRFYIKQNHEVSLSL